MDPCNVLIDKLKQHPELIYVELPNGVHIKPHSPTSFAVELRTEDKGWVVYLGNAGFHEQFGSAEDVLNFVAWCYSGLARLREVWRGRIPQKSTLEAFEDGEWSWVSETGFVFIPFWRRRHEVLLSNSNLLSD